MTPTTEALPSAAFARRYLVARYDSGGVVIDLESGNYFRVNRTAALVCDALSTAPDAGAAVAAVASELKIQQDEAEVVVAQVAAALDVPTVRGEIQGAYHFFPTATGYELRHGDAPVLELNADGSQVRIASASRRLAPKQIELYVRALAPKILFQKQITVLHASCCIAREQMIAFAGVSRAGKTTTARAFAAAGATLVAEDLVVFAPGTTASVLLRAEAVVDEWARTTAARLSADESEPVSVATLSEEAVQGPVGPLRKILFVDSRRREGVDFRVDRANRSDALAELLRHDFLGAAEPDSWRRFFQAAVALVGRADVGALWTPEGVEGLRAAAARYISTTAS